MRISPPSSPSDVPDDAIDQALAVLRNAPSPEGLEARVLASLCHHEPLPHAARTHLRRWLPAALTLATAAALIAMLFLRTSNHPSVSALAPVSHSTFLHAATHSSLPPLARRTHALRTPTPLIPASVQLTSYPAPPAPLTEQEKLLLEIAHRGDREDFELLNPETVTRELAQNMAEFDHFFPPPPPFGPPAPKPSTETPTPNPISTTTPNQEIPNEAHPIDR